MPGFIRDEDINEVRHRVDLVEIISPYVNLKKSGRLFKGLCPFHKEKTPSFFVDPAKQLYHCFGCGEGGTAYTFIMKIDNLDFPEAVKYLAEKVGYRLRYERPEEAQKLSQKARLYQACHEAMLFYHHLLMGTDEGKAALDYLKNRGYNSGIIGAFRLGFAPGKWDSLLKHLQSKGLKAPELLEAGLIIKSERGISSHYDRFRGRVIFPIFDLRGRTIAFGGRIIKEKEGEVKYLNSPETPIYHKGANLYGLFLARGDLVKEGRVAVVEGYTDVLSLHQAGIHWAVATLGTALTAEQIRLLARFTEQIILVFDADAAGSAAAERGFDLLGDSNVDLYVVSLPPDTDPADFVATRGGEEFKKFLDQALPLVEFCLNQTLSRYNLREPSGRIKGSEATLSLIASLTSAVAQEQYLTRLADKLAPYGVSPQSLFAEWQKKHRQKKSGPLEIFTENGKIDGQAKAEQEILKLILQYPGETENVVQELEAEDFTFPECRELFLFIKANLDRFKVGAVNLVDKIPENALRSLGTKLLLEPLVVDDQKKYLKDIFKKLKEFTLQRQISGLKSKLEKLNPTTNPNYDSLFEELLRLEMVKRRLKEDL